jgi:hypothetical protein
MPREFATIKHWPPSWSTRSIKVSKRERDISRTALGSKASKPSSSLDGLGVDAVDVEELSRHCCPGWKALASWLKYGISTAAT